MTTRTIRSFGDHIYIDGLTSGPSGGWTWDGTHLAHPDGITMTMASAAADRITATIASYQPVQPVELTSAGIDQLPDAERQRWLAGIEAARRDPHGDTDYRLIVTDDGVALCRWHPTPTPAACKFDISEVLRIDRRRQTPRHPVAGPEMDPLTADATYPGEQ